MELKETNYDRLKEIANELRIKVLEMVYQAGSGHIGGSFSICELLSVLYFQELNVNPRNPGETNRDRFVLSKGHAAPALYAILAKKGYFPERDLYTLRKIGSKLQGHPDMKKVPGVEISSGSLGMGISFGIGTQLAARLDSKSYRTFVLTGCGELDEGQNWEGFLTGAKYRLNNLIVIIDYNKVQLDGFNSEILPLNNLRDKIQSFNWNVLECDGHNVRDIIEKISRAKEHSVGPTAIIANTIKGKGVSFMENSHEWHGKNPSEEEYQQALAELKGVLV